MTRTKLRWWRGSTIRTRAIGAVIGACLATLLASWAIHVAYWKSGGRERLFAALDRGVVPPLDLFLLSLLPPLAIGLGMGIVLGIIATVRMRTMEIALREVENGNWHASLPEPPAADYAMVQRAFSAMTRAIDELTSRLQHADRQRRRLFADLAHELSTPTASIVAVADALADPRFDNEALKSKLLKSLDEESRRLERLIKDIRELANLDDPDVAFHFAPADVSDIAKRFAERSNLVSSEARVEVVTAEPMVIEVDEMRLEQVLTNFVGNSRRYTPRDGAVRISVNWVPDGVQLVIEDTGPGVRDSVLPRLGERLLRVDPSRARATGGAGLGLSIVSAIVQRHHGTLSFDRGALGGLAARITLPLVQPTDTSAKSSSVLDENATEGNRDNAP